MRRHGACNQTPCAEDKATVCTAVTAATAAVVLLLLLLLILLLLQSAETFDEKSCNIWLDTYAHVLERERGRERERERGRERERKSERGKRERDRKRERGREILAGALVNKCFARSTC